MSSHDQKLQKLHDGELSPAEVEALERSLTAADRDKLLGLREIDDLVGNTLRTEAGARDLDLWKGLSARIPALAAEQMSGKLSAPLPMQTGSQEVRPAPVIGTSKVVKDGGSMGTVLHFTPARRRLMGRVTAVVSALAMAAAFALWLKPAPAQTNHCDVESLEVAGGSATVLKVQGDHDDTTTVLWVDHDEGDEWETL